MWPGPSWSSPTRTRTGSRATSSAWMAAKISPVDVVVVGGGDAAFCAGLAARDRGGRGPPPGEAASGEPPPYTEANFYDDLMRVTENLSDPDLADVLVAQSRPTIVWLRSHGVRWILMFGRQSYKVGDRHRFWGGLAVEAVGGGPGLVQALYDRAAALGIEVCYETKATRLLLDDRGAIRGVVCQGPAGLAAV